MEGETPSELRRFDTGGDHNDTHKLHRVLTGITSCTASSPDDAETIARETFAFPLEQGEESHRAAQLHCGIMDGVRNRVSDTMP